MLHYYKGTTNKKRIIKKHQNQINHFKAV